MQSINVFNNHNAVIDQHADRENQRKKHHHIQGNAHHRHDREGEQHRQGNGHTDEQAVAVSHDDEQDYNHEDKTGYNVVFQLLEHISNIIGVVLHNGDFDLGGQVPLLEQFLDGIDHLNRVFAGAFVDFKRDRRFSVNAGRCFQILEGVENLGNVAQINGLILALEHDHIAQIRGEFNFAGYTHLYLILGNFQHTGGNGNIFAADQPENVQQRNVVFQETRKIKLHPDFAFARSRNTSFFYAGDRFNIVLKRFRRAF